MHRRWGILAAMGVYFFWGSLLILQKPGLQYDEAFLVAGAVRMLHPAAPYTITGSPVWIQLFHRFVPLMGGGIPYIGALKDYLALPLFAVFGARTSSVRLLSMLLGFVGIWGTYKLLRERAGSAAAAATALALAINPAYLAMTVFDNSAFSEMMAGFGLVCAALAFHLRRRSVLSALLLGAAMGFGIWTRANFLWILAAGGLAALVVFRRRTLAPAVHWIAISGGGILGGFPFLLYQFASHGATWNAMRELSAPQPLNQLLSYRLSLLLDTLLSDGEHRLMWGRTALPAWQTWGCLLVAVAGLLICLCASESKRPGRAEAARFAGWALLFLGASLFLSRLQVAEHHLIALVPFAAVVIVLSCSILQARYRWGRFLVAAAAVIYAGSAVYWNIAAIRGLRKTGGIGMWSDGIFELARQIDGSYRGREIKILDWGLQANLYVLTDGRLQSEDLSVPESPTKSSRGWPWVDEIRAGGVFLLNGPHDREFPGPSEAFLAAFNKVKPVARWRSIAQRDGEIYAQLIDIEPGSFQMPAFEKNLSPSLSMSDPSVEEQLRGFYPIENGGRWTRREFGVTLGNPQPSGGGIRFVMRFYIPEASIQKLGPVTLRARVGGHELMPETYAHSGLSIFTRDLSPGWIPDGPIRFDFTLDKALPPSASDSRELGIIALATAIEPY
ncbi:MAG TPA: glycosyltransferase family 39 protein [Bryobacteraceae bacterium]|nr:glycosyltransferase family 39 protein [Bryobacteraceae bacterium]